MLSEALGTALLAALLGVGLGLLLARLALRLVSPVSALYVLEHVTHLILTWDTVLIGMGLGIGTALLSAAWPTLTALRLSPLAAMQQRGVYSGRQTLWPSTLVGLCLVLAAYGLSRLPAVAGMSVWVSRLSGARAGSLLSHPAGVSGHDPCRTSDPDALARGRGAVGAGQPGVCVTALYGSHCRLAHQFCDDDQRRDHDREF